MLVKCVKELVIYQKARQLAKEIYKLTGQIPFYWKIKEVDDIRRSSSSVCSNIAEGFGNRFYIKKFIYYLYISLGSSDETQDHLAKLANNKHIATYVARHYTKQYKDLSIRITNFITYLRKRSDKIQNL